MESNDTVSKPLRIQRWLFSAVDSFYDGLLRWLVWQLHQLKLISGVAACLVTIWLCLLSAIIWFCLVIGVIAGVLWLIIKLADLIG